MWKVDKILVLLWRSYHSRNLLDANCVLSRTRTDKLMTEKALILDFGGVISRTLFETHALTEHTLGLPAGTLTWRGPFDPESDPLWCAVQKEEIGERDYWIIRTQEVGSLCGKDWTTVSEFVQASRGAEPAQFIRPEALMTIKQASAMGCRLAILSNDLDLFYGSNFRKQLPFMELFTVIVDGSYSNVLKPDPRAYQTCLDKLAIPASHCVFVDDQYRNIVGARNVGMQALHFKVQQPKESYQQALNLLSVE